MHVFLRYVGADDGVLHCNRLTVRESEFHGIVAKNGSKVDLSDCSVTGSENDGACISDTDTNVKMTDCKFTSCQKNGIKVCSAVGMVGHAVVPLILKSN